MQTILGINGSVGSGLAAALKSRNIPVRGVGRKPSKGDWQSVQGDLTNPTDVMSVVDGSEVVYLIAGLKYDVRVWKHEWPLIMENVLEACLASGSKLVFLDNVYALGKVNGPITENLPNKPVSEKGKVRAQIADKLMEFTQKHGLKACIARAADFYGPHCATSVLNSTVFERHAAGKTAFWMGDPGKIHTFTYVPDIGPALATLGNDDRADGKIWHVPTTHELWTGNDWVKASAERFNVPAKSQATGKFILRTMGLFNRLFYEMVEMNYQFENDYIFDSTLTEKTFGLKPTSNTDGLEASVAFYK